MSPINVLCISYILFVGSYSRLFSAPARLYACCKVEDQSSSPVQQSSPVNRHCPGDMRRLMLGASDHSLVWMELGRVTKQRRKHK